MMLNFVYAKLSITLTSAAKNPLGVYIYSDNKELEELVRKDINLSGLLTANQHYKPGQMKYEIKNECLYKPSGQKLVCLKGQASTSQAAHVFAESIFEETTGKKAWFTSKIALVTADMQGYKHRKYRLEVVDSAGENPQTIFASNSPIMSPAWSPDGQYIAYVSFEKGKASLWQQNLRSGQRNKLSDTPGINGAPAWSPNQQQIAFVLSVQGTPKIYILDINSRKLRQVTSGTSLDTEPCWHPSGNSLFYTSSKSGNPQIYQLDLASGQSKRISFFGDYNATPSISKDGRRMAALTRNSGRYMVVVYDMLSQDHHILSAKGTEEQPMIHEGGEAVIFGLREGERMQIAMAQVDTASRYKLPSDQGWARFASWSPSLKIGA